MGPDAEILFAIYVFSFILIVFYLGTGYLIAKLLQYFCCFFYSLIDESPNSRPYCNCAFPPSYIAEHNDCGNVVQICPHDKKLLIYLPRGILNINAQSSHITSRTEVTLLGGLTAFCLCTGSPSNLVLFTDDDYTLTEIPTKIEHARFFVVQHPNVLGFQPLSLTEHSVISLYKNGSTSQYFRNSNLFPPFMNKLITPMHMGYLPMRECSRHTSWNIDVCRNPDHYKF